MTKVRGLGYQTGVYSSAGSGIVMLDQALASGRDFAYPDYIWIARWDGVANTSTTYISDERWEPAPPGQAEPGGHLETWEASRSTSIATTSTSAGNDRTETPRALRRSAHRLVELQAARSRRRLAVPGQDPAVSAEDKGAVLRPDRRPLRRRHASGCQHLAASGGATLSDMWTINNWVTLLTDGNTPVVKIGSGRYAVRRLQRALNAVLRNHDHDATGVFGPATERALRVWQRRKGLPATGVVAWNTWAALQR